MNLPPFVYSLRFWEAVALIVAVVVAHGGVADPETTLKILAAVLAVLRLIGVNPELRARGRVK
jgi:hypothetical protein